MLREAGHKRLFDKGRGPGGRLSGRRHDLGAIDHGAQYFTVRDADFRVQVDNWIEMGSVLPWEGRFATDRPVAKCQASPALPRCALNERIFVRWRKTFHLLVNSHSSPDSRGRTSWHMTDTDGNDFGPFERVVIAIPPPQAAELLSVHPEFLSAVEKCRADPCWAVMCWLHDDAGSQPAWDTWSSENHPRLAWLSWEQQNHKESLSRAISAQCCLVDSMR